jgi:hypothetical protein
MIEVRPEGCIFGQDSNITPKWKDMRNTFGYKKLGEIAWALFSVMKLVVIYESF